ncbi:mitochondrial carrier [Serendipita vermifera]|nr:mitochondrial carrier [Serendipita vermifera]
MDRRPNDDTHSERRVWLGELNPFKDYIESGQLNRLLKDNKPVVSATTASLLSTFAGYPLDSLKSRLQASRVPITVPRLAVNIFQEEGIVGFYRGLWIPLVTISAVRAISFTIYNGTKEWLYKERHWSNERLLTIGGSGAIGGALAGCMISFGSCPFELVKVRRQLEYSIAAAKGIHIVKPPGTWSAVKEIVSGSTSDRMGNPGASMKGIPALWTGMRLHLLRDTSGTALYFFEYDCMRHLLGRTPDGKQGPTPDWAPIHPSVVPFVCGSLAGVSSWAIIYPLDVVKTKTQQRALSGERYRGPIETLTRLLKGPEHAPRTVMDGFARLYRGLGVSAIRSVTTHGLLWTFLDYVGSHIDRLPTEDRRLSHA